MVNAVVVVTNVAVVDDAVVVLVVAGLVAAVVVVDVVGRIFAGIVSVSVCAAVVIDVVIVGVVIYNFILLSCLLCHGNVRMLAVVYCRVRMHVVACVVPCRC